MPVSLLLAPILASWALLAGVPGHAPLAGGCVLPQAAIETPAPHYDGFIGPILEETEMDAVPPDDCIEEQTGAPILPG
jgi:hypothetical protein